MSPYDQFNEDGAERLRYEFPLTAESRVIDAGAFTGEWSARIAEKFGCHIEAFEPIRKYAEVYRQRMNGFRSRMHVCALSDRDGAAEIVVDQEANSIVWGRVGRDIIPVETVEASRYFEELGLPDIDLMKVNIEGAEYALMEHLIATGWIPRIRSLLIQWHRFLPEYEARYEGIRAGLEATHRLLWDYPWVWQAWERIEA